MSFEAKDHVAASAGHYLPCNSWDKFLNKVWSTEMQLTQLWHRTIILMPKWEVKSETINEQKTGRHGRKGSKSFNPDFSCRNHHHHFSWSSRITSSCCSLFMYTHAITRILAHGIKCQCFDTSLWELWYYTNSNYTTLTQYTHIPSKAC